jgi:hypothetical protein
MPNWFLGKIRYQQPIDDSNVGTRNQEFIKAQTVTEAYLVDAVSYTEAEARLYQEIAANTPEFEITNISRMLLADVFFNEEDGGETWYKVKANYLLEDDKTGKQKKAPVAMLINAQNPKQAYERIEYSLKTSLDPFEITDVNTTKILDVFPFVGDEQRNLTPLAEALDSLKDDGVSVSVSVDGGETYKQIV